MGKGGREMLVTWQLPQSASSDIIYFYCLTPPPPPPVTILPSPSIHSFWLVCQVAPPTHKGGLKPSIDRC